MIYGYLVKVTFCFMADGSTKVFGLFQEECAKIFVYEFWHISSLMPFMGPIDGLFLSFDGLPSVGTYGDYGDRSLKLFFKEFDVVFELGREFLFALHSCHVGLPSGQGSVDRFDVLFN